MVEVNQIDPMFVSIMNLSHSDIRVCYKNKCRIFFLAPSFVGKLTIYDSDSGFSPKVTAKKPTDGILSRFKSALEQRAGKPVNFYLKFQQAQHLNVFMNMRKYNDQSLFPVRVDGINQLMTISDMKELSGLFKMLLKAGKLKDTGKMYMWTICCEEISVDTSVEVANADDYSTQMKFLHLL